MRKLKLAFSAVFLVSQLPSATAANNPVTYSRADLAAASTLRERARDDSTAYELVESLTTEVGPRFPGTPGDKAGVDWAVREMRRLGLANVRTSEAPVPNWVRGEAGFTIVGPWPQSMPTVVLGGSVGTVPEGIEADAVRVRDVAELEALPPGSVRDRIVFFDQRMERTRDGSGYVRAVTVRSTGPSAAAALGAIGVVIRSIGTGDHRFAHTGALKYNPAAPRIPAFALSNPDADSLARQFASGKTVRLRLRSSARVLPDARSANVIGEIPGADLAQEIVILGAHLDSWDLGVGAVDNAAGCAILMSVAKLIGELDVKPRRTIRVVLFANEESGQSGSVAYLAAHESEVSRHVLGFEADFGAGPVWRLSSRVSPAQLPAVDQMFRAMAPFGLVRGGNDARGGADLDGLARLGMALIDPGLDGTRYFDVHHTADDTLARVDPEAIRQSVGAFAVSVWLGAQYPGTWERVTVPKPARR